MPGQPQPRLTGVGRLSLVSFALAIAVACGGAGPGLPITGEINGTFLTTPFAPKFGIALDLVSPQDSQGAAQVQVSDAPINCTENFAAPTSAGKGLYALLYLANWGTGAFTAQLVKFERVVVSDHVIYPDLAFFGNHSSGEITAVDADHVEGSITFDAADPNQAANFSGTFSVTRCH